jgi:hypothetical protein
MSCWRWSTNGPAFCPEDWAADTCAFTVAICAVSVDLADGLRYREVHIALQRRQVRGGLIERTSKILRSGKDALAGIQIARIGGKARETVEEAGKRAL